MGPVILARDGPLVLVDPAPFWASRELVDGAVRRKPILRSAALRMLADGANYGIERDGRLLAVVLFWPLDDGGEEVMTWGRPAAELRPVLGGIVRLGRLTLVRRRQDGVVRFRALVLAENASGHKLAHLAGLVDEAKGAPPGYLAWEG